MIKQCDLLFGAVLIFITSIAYGNENDVHVSARVIQDPQSIEVFLDGRGVPPPYYIGRMSIELKCKNDKAQNYIHPVDFPKHNLEPNYYRGVVVWPTQCLQLLGFGKYNVTLETGKADKIAYKDGSISKHKPEGKPSEITYRFDIPVYNGHRVDWCKIWGNECGKAAADNFCRKKGFVQALSYMKDENIGLHHNTYVINDNKLCAFNYCDGFRFIICQ